MGQGFDPRFGLIEIDYNNFRRIKKQFAYIYSNICRRGSAALNDQEDGF